MPTTQFQVEEDALDRSEPFLTDRDGAKLADTLAPDPPEEPPRRARQIVRIFRRAEQRAVRITAAKLARGRFGENDRASF